MKKNTYLIQAFYAGPLSHIPQIVLETGTWHIMNDLHETVVDTFSIIY